jgi:hypothetical protein
VAGTGVSFKTVLCSEDGDLPDVLAPHCCGSHLPSGSLVCKDREGVLKNLPFKKPSLSSPLPLGEVLKKHILLFYILYYSWSLTYFSLKVLN